MADSCCPGNTTASPTVPTISIYSNAGRFCRGISLPSSCRSRTWQLVTCKENHRSFGSAPSDYEAASCQPTHLPATSCVGFVCQPICSCTACYEPSAGQSPCPVSSCQPSCSESTSCYESSSCQQISYQEPVCMSGSCQVACDQPASCDPKSCPPSCCEVIPCPETSRSPTVCGASPCQPTCCQAGSCQPISGEGQSCQPMYYQPICYIFKPCQPVVSMPVPCQPSTCVFSPYNTTCYVPSPCQLLHCQSVPSMPFICQPAVSCQPPCSAKNPCKPASGGTVCSGQPAGGGSPPCNHSGCKSPSLPACCVTGYGNPRGGGSSGFQPAPPSLCKTSACLPGSCQHSHKSGVCKPQLPDRAPFMPPPGSAAPAETLCRPPPAKHRAVCLLA